MIEILYICTIPIYNMTPRGIGKVMSKKSAGYELIRDRERLEKLHPDLVTSYRDFLRDFAHFQEVQEQFAERSRKPAADRTPFAARLK